MKKDRSRKSALTTVSSFGRVLLLCALSVVSHGIGSNLPLFSQGLNNLMKYL